MFDKLIAKVVDDEATPLERKVCGFLCSRFSTFQKCKQNLETLSAECKCQKKNFSTISDDVFWERFNQRVSEEQYLERFYTRVPLSAPSPKGRLGLSISVLGGVCACALGLLFVIPQNQSPNSVSSQNSFPLSFVQSFTEQNKISRSGAPTVSDVEWVRSPGRVSVLKPKSNSSPILWVRKKDTPYGSHIPVKIGRSFPAQEFPQ